jgi:hypothetical protein
MKTTRNPLLFLVVLFAIFCFQQAVNAETMTDVYWAGYTAYGYPDVDGSCTASVSQSLVPTIHIEGKARSNLTSDGLDMGLYSMNADYTNSRTYTLHSDVGASEDFVIQGPGDTIDALVSFRLTGSMWISETPSGSYGQVSNYNYLSVGASVETQDGTNVDGFSGYLTMEWRDTNDPSTNGFSIYSGYDLFVFPLDYYNEDDGLPPGYNSYNDYIDIVRYSNMYEPSTGLDYVSPTQPFEPIFPYDGYLAIFDDMPIYLNLLDLPLNTPLEYSVGLNSSIQGWGAIDFLNTLTFADNPIVFGEFIGQDFIPLDDQALYSVVSTSGGIAMRQNGNGASVPEPSTMLLIATGLVGLAGFRRRFKS